MGEPVDRICVGAAIEMIMARRDPDLQIDDHIPEDLETLKGTAVALAAICNAVLCQLPEIEPEDVLEILGLMVAGSERFG